VVAVADEGAVPVTIDDLKQSIIRLRLTSLLDADEPLDGSFGLPEWRVRVAEEEIVT
jgi:hypothetical protein